VHFFLNFPDRPTARAIFFKLSGPADCVCNLFLTFLTGRLRVQSLATHRRSMGHFSNKLSGTVSQLFSRFRWLACSCFACREGVFDGCLNVRYIAHWTMFEFSRAIVDGIGQRRLRRFNLAKEIWESVKKTNIVAVFNSTTDDASPADRATPTRPYWLATVCH
jgi:hypothetical protein